MTQAKSQSTAGPSSTRKRKKLTTPPLPVDSLGIIAYLEAREINESHIELTCDPSAIVEQVKASFESQFPHLSINVSFAPKAMATQAEKAV